MLEEFAEGNHGAGLTQNAKTGSKAM